MDGMATVARWGRFAALLGLAALVLGPLELIVGRAFQGPAEPTLDGLFGAPRFGPALTWFGNSLAVSTATVLVSLVVAAPAGYVLSRARGRRVSAYGLVLFALQSLPAVVLVIPLFVVFARTGLVDSLPGLTIVYIGSTIAVAVWMIAAATDAVPIAIEEAAWLDGCSIVGGYLRMVLPNLGPGLVSAAILVFLQAWNEYLVAVVFLRSDANKTLGVALAGAQSPALAVLMMLPPVLVVVLLGRFVRIGPVRI